MTTIATDQLATIAGGVFRTNGTREAYQNICTGKDARAQYETMLKQMVPDKSEAPGFKRRTVKAVADLCHWPFPK
jgi:hypothetical protein